jgi:hypothetical protein
VPDDDVEVVPELTPAALVVVVDDGPAVVVAALVVVVAAFVVVVDPGGHVLPEYAWQELLANAALGATMASPTATTSNLFIVDAYALS